MTEEDDLVEVTIYVPALNNNARECRTCAGGCLLPEGNHREGGNHAAANATDTDDDDGVGHVHETGRRARRHVFRPLHSSSAPPSTLSTSVSVCLEYACCIRAFRAVKRSADMNAIYCCAPCKPRYRRLVDNIYPRAINEGLIGQQMQKLTFYSISHPEKLERIGEYLVQRMARDLARLRFIQVKIAVEAMDQLLEACHSSPSLVQFSESHLKMVQKLLESNLPNMEQLATASFVKFSNIEENSPSYHRQYDFFICKFSQMCHSQGEHWKEMRCAGLRGLRGVVWKSVTDGLHPNIWERQHMDKIVPSVLYNLQDDEDDVKKDDDVPDLNRSRLSARNVFSTVGDDEDARERNDPRTLSDQCLRELMGKATFGSLRAVIEPVLKHIDLHGKWQPPATFAIHLFRVILYSIQTQNTYFVIQELINHLDTMSSSDARVRIGIASVLSSIVSIAGTSIGPLLLSIFNSLLKHLRTSVEFQLSKRCPAPDLETTYQETLINAMGDFANALPDYQKVEMMMFTVGNIPNLSSTGTPMSASPPSLVSSSSAGSDAFLQHVLVKTLLKVATKYRTAYLATVFTDSLALVSDAQVRLTTLYIFHTLLDRHDNLSSLAHLGYVLNVDELQLSVEKCSRADQMFMRKHVGQITTMLYHSVVLADGTEKEVTEALDAVQCIMSLMCVEVGYDEVLVELVRLSLALQENALDPEATISEEKRAWVHNLIARYLNLSSQLLAQPTLIQHIRSVVAARAQRGPSSLNLLADVEERSRRRSDEGESPEREKDEESATARVELGDIELAGGLLFDGDVISDCLKAAGKDVTRLVPPFTYNAFPTTASKGTLPFFSQAAATTSITSPDGASTTTSQRKGSAIVIEGAEPLRLDQSGADADSLDLSFDWSPPDSPAHGTGRRNTIFTLAPAKPGSFLPVSVHALRTMVNTPPDPAEESRKELEMTTSVVEQLRTRTFEEISDEICRHNEEGDIIKAVSRLLARNDEAVKMSELGRPGGGRPKNIYEIELPSEYVF